MNKLFFSIFLPLVSLQAMVFAQTGHSQTGSALEVRVRDSSNISQNDTDSSKTINNLQTQTLEQTLSIIKPDAVKNRHIGDIISRFEDKGLRVIALKMVKLNQEEAGKFYEVHKGRPFYMQLVEFMSSGPVVVMVLEGDHAISKTREIMGATNPKEAAQGTIRSDFAQSMTQNAVHGSDSPQTAREEIKFFFNADQIYPQR